MSAGEFSEDTKKKISELEDATGAKRAEHSIRARKRDRAAQNIVMGTEEQKQEGSSRRRTSPYKEKSKRWDWRGDARTFDKMITGECMAIAHVVRHGPAFQTLHEQQETIKDVKNNYMLEELDEETLRATTKKFRVRG